MCYKSERERGDVYVCLCVFIRKLAFFFNPDSSRLLVQHVECLRFGGCLLWSVCCATFDFVHAEFHCAIVTKISHNVITIPIHH